MRSLIATQKEDVPTITIARARIRRGSEYPRRRAFLGSDGTRRSNVSANKLSIEMANAKDWSLSLIEAGVIRLVDGMAGCGPVSSVGRLYRIF